MPSRSESPIYASKQHSLSNGTAYHRLGLLNCNEPPFDTIASGMYQPPKGTNPGTQLLIKNLKRLAEVPECKLELTETLHSKG